MSAEDLREADSTYFVQDRSSREEMHRLDIQDRMMTKSQGGVLEDELNPTRLRRVLDVGCGTGDWLVETARTYPMIKQLVGVDISDKMLAYAQEKVQDLDKRVRFQTMDALRLLEFREANFDLVNQRAAASWLRTWNWKKILMEYQRVTRSGGIIRITEPTVGMESSSPALTKLWSILLETFYNSGRLFAPHSKGVIEQLVPLMTQHGIKNIQTRTYNPVYQGGTAEGAHLYEDMQRLFHVLLPFFHKWTRVSDDYQDIYQQAMKEMQHPDFTATWLLFTAWGTTP